MKLKNADFRAQNSNTNIQRCPFRSACEYMYAYVYKYLLRNSFINTPTKIKLKGTLIFRVKPDNDKFMFTFVDPLEVIARLTPPSSG